MLIRIVSLVLIAAVIACPLSCGAGLCHVNGPCCADECDSGATCSRAACLQHDEPGGCCERRTDQDEERGPRPWSDEPLCQGVCGGAVFEEPCEPAGSDASGFLPLPRNDGLFVSLVAPREMVTFELPNRDRTGNHGRFMRIRYLSLLC